MSLKKTLLEKKAEAQRKAAEQLDREWEQREAIGQTTIDQLMGKHWESTRPSERTTDQIRDKLLWNLRHFKSTKKLDDSK